MIESIKKFIKKSAESQTYKKNILLKVVQQYYIEIWLMVQERYECLTFPSDLYRAGYVSCPFAEQMAKKRVAKIEQNGHINRNYKRLVNMLADSNLSISSYIYRLARKNRKRVLI